MLEHTEVRTKGERNVDKIGKHSALSTKTHAVWRGLANSNSERGAEGSAYFRPARDFKAAHWLLLEGTSVHYRGSLR